MKMPKNYYTVNQLIGSYYIRYDRLYELITSYYSGSSAENIDLYLDVTPLIKNLYGNIDVRIDSISLVACLKPDLVLVREYLSYIVA